MDNIITPNRNGSQFDNKSKSVKGTLEKDGKKVIDFDNLEEVQTKFRKQKMEQNMINLGYWIQKEHPNFFSGNCYANLRYIKWLFWSLLIFLTQWTFLFYYCKEDALDWKLRYEDGQYKMKILRMMMNLILISMKINDFINQSSIVTRIWHELIYNDNVSCGLRMKYLVLIFMTVGEMVFEMFALILGFSVIEGSDSLRDILQKSVKVFILLSIDNWGSVILFFWIDYNYPVLTMDKDFMQLKVDRRARNVANFQAQTAFIICSINLFTVTNSGQTVIDYFFEKAIKPESFNIFIVSVQLIWLLYSYATTQIYYSCYDPESKVEDDEKAPNASNNEEADLEKGKNKKDSSKETKSQKEPLLSAQEKNESAATNKQGYSIN